MRVHHHRVAKRSPAKRLPQAFRSLVLHYDYGIVKFRGRGGAYKADGRGLDLRVVQNSATFDAQVQIHCSFRGKDNRSGKVKMLDVDPYLPIPAFKRASRLLRGIRFRNRHGVLRIPGWRDSGGEG